MDYRDEVKILSEKGIFERNEVERNRSLIKFAILMLFLNMSFLIFLVSEHIHVC